MSSTHRFIAAISFSMLFFVPVGHHASAADQTIATPAALEQAGYGVYWSATLPLRGGHRVAGVSLLDENLYVQTAGGMVYAIQADTGLLRWVQSLDSYSTPTRAPTHVRTDDGDGPAVFVTRAQAYFFDRYSGDSLLELELPVAASSGAVADMSSMYLGGADGLFYSLRWRCYGCGLPLVAWRAMLPGIATSTPILTELDRLYFASDGVVHCVQAPGKTKLWSFCVCESVAGDIHADESGVYVASRNQKLYILDPDDGSLIRSYRLPRPLDEGPVVAQRTVYQYCPNEGLYAFDTDTHEPLWHKQDGRAFVARQAEWLVLRTASGDLQVVDNDTAAVLHTVNLPDSVMLATNARDANIYAVTPDGRVLCAKRLGFPYLRREKILSARARLNARPVSVLPGVGEGSGPGASAGQSGAKPVDPFKSTIDG